MKLCKCKKTFNDLWEMFASKDGYPDYMEGPIFENRLYKYFIVDNKFYHIYTLDGYFYAIFRKSNFDDAFYDKGIFRNSRINKLLK